MHSSSGLLTALSGGVLLGFGLYAAATLMPRAGAGDDADSLRAARVELAATKAELEAAQSALAAARRGGASGSATAAAAAAPLPVRAPLPPPPSPMPARALPRAASDGASAGSGVKRRPIRIYMDGVFDLMHYGHSNALRQAKAVGDVLVVGLVADDEVIRNKGSAPVMPEQERFTALSGCKFVDEVIRNAPYDLTEEWVTELVQRHAIDYIVHGDDPCITADGKDAYAYAKSIGKYKQIKRTEGVSTTDIVGRMLLMTKDHHVHHGDGDGSSRAGSSAGGGGGAVASSTAAGGEPSISLNAFGGGGAPPSAAAASSLSLSGLRMPAPPSPEGGGGSGGGGGGRLERTVRSSSLGSLASLSEKDASALVLAMHPDPPAHEDDGSAGGAGASAGSAPAAAALPPPPPPPPSALAPLMPPAHSKFLPTARRIMQFADGKAPKAEDIVVYIAGGWDLFNAGHIAALSEARKFGTFLLVGIHDDATVNALRGHGLPILNLYERTLSLLSCKHVDEVIIGAPWECTEDLIKTMNIRVVVRGSVSDSENALGHEHLGWSFRGAEAQSAIARAYAVPAAMGILRTFASPTPLTALDIIDRILLSRAAFQTRYEKKSKMESAYYEKKDFVAEA